ncbi:site-specific integrase [Rhodococcus sp. JVH1]|uniref:site-specific integrase n=1 Tax=Rhodococcus sp. JVH1 TaxID=745408 RepID=UPI0006871917|nr:site-specific integrase [Rhodococcus sp. JVH1]
MTIDAPEIEAPYVTKLVTPSRFVRQSSTPLRVGAANHLSIDEVMVLVRRLPLPRSKSDPKRNKLARGAFRILQWLDGYEGAGWQDRWMAAGGEHRNWMDELSAGDTRSMAYQRQELTIGLTAVFLSRAVLPSYHVLNRSRSRYVFDYSRLVLDPDGFTAAEEVARGLDCARNHQDDGIRVLTRMVLYTGRRVRELTAQDVHEYHTLCRDEVLTTVVGIYPAWDILQRMGILDSNLTLRDQLRHGQVTTAAVIDSYNIRTESVREMLVRYMDERRTQVDYNTFRAHAGILAGTFWRDIEVHHPEVDSLRLSDEVVAAWKQRLRFATGKGGKPRPRRRGAEILMRIRSLYLDIQEMAHEDPWWAQYAVPCPISRTETRGLGKTIWATRSAMHQRVRERLPHLQSLVDSAREHRDRQAALLAAATAVALGETFEFDGDRYRLRKPRVIKDREPSVQVDNLRTGEMINIRQVEDEAFWVWAIIETLRHTGVRVEELLELTHLALVSYRIPETGELVPLLQVAPSKNNEERLLLVSPELASVLATVIARVRAKNSGTIPLVARYDPHERVTGPPLPHLFQRRHGARIIVIATATIKTMLASALERAGLRDAAGEPLQYTAHDFRRMFATDAVTGGLPVHIAARLLGHRSLDTIRPTSIGGPNFARFRGFSFRNHPSPRAGHFAIPQAEPAPRRSGVRARAGGSPPSFRMRIVDRSPILQSAWHP